MTSKRQSRFSCTVTRKPKLPAFALVVICLMICSMALATAAPAPTYRIYPLRNGVCKIAGNHAYHKGDNAETYDFALYIWLLLGGDKPILIDAGLSDVDEMNRGAAPGLRKPTTPNNDERSTAHL